MLGLEGRANEVAIRLLHGYDNKEIAKELGCSLRTIKSHTSRLYLRFGILKGYKRAVLAVMLQKEELGDIYLEPQELRVKITKRQKDVVSLIAQGYKNAEIGKILGTTEHVVKNYLRYLYDEIGLSTRIELAMWAHQKQAEGAFQIIPFDEENINAIST